MACAACEERRRLMLEKIAAAQARARAMLEAVTNRKPQQEPQDKA